MNSNFNVVLVEPEIPNNTGNVGRTCVATNSALHLIEPLGFEINDRQLKRAGLDYWPNLQWTTHKSFDQWHQTPANPNRVFYFSTKTDRPHYEIEFQPGDYLVFGKETKGLSEDHLKSHWDQVFTIPMFGKTRSLNLANSVAIVLYEGIRQLSAQGAVRGMT